MAKQRSDVWEYFKKISNKEAICSICEHVLKSCGNTTNLRSHLVKAHKILKGLDKPVIKKNIVSPKRKISSGNASKLKVHFFKAGCKSQKNTKKKLIFQEPSTSAFKKDALVDIVSEPTSVMKVSSSVFQPTMDAFFDLDEKVPESGSQHFRITQKLIFFICKDCHPVSVVEGTGFNALMKMVSPLYKIPSLSTVENLINQKFLSLRSSMKEKLALIPFFSVTTDIWSHVTTSTDYLEMSVHFIDGNSRQSIGLGVFELEDSSSTQYLRTKIEDVLTEWGLPEEKIVCVVSGNETTFVKPVCDGFWGKKHLRCVAYSVKSVADTVMAEEDLQLILQKVREIVHFFESSIEASCALCNARKSKKNLKSNGHGLVLDVKTQWTSSLSMLLRFLEQSDVINSVMLENPKAPPMLTELELETIKEVKTILSFLEKFTGELSSELYMSASEMIPLLNCFWQSLAKFEPKHSLSKNLLNVLTEKFEFLFKDREQTLMLSIPMVLDPRFKTLHFSDASACSLTVSPLRGLLSKVKETEVLSKSLIESDDEINFEVYHKSLANLSLKGMSCQGFVDSELDLYLSTPVTSNLRADPIELWEDLKDMYPKLYYLAKKYLTTVVTSVPADRLFSNKGDIIKDKRNGLERECLPKILFLNNLPLKYWF